MGHEPHDHQLETLGYRDPPNLRIDAYAVCIAILNLWMR